MEKNKIFTMTLLCTMLTFNALRSAPRTSAKTHHPYQLFTNA